MEAQAKEIRMAKQRGSVSFDRRFHVQDFVVKLDLCIRLFEMNKILSTSITPV